MEEYKEIAEIYDWVNKTIICDKEVVGFEVSKFVEINGYLLWFIAPVNPQNTPWRFVD